MQICHNTRKTNPWVKVKVAIGRCLSYSRTGNQSSSNSNRFFLNIRTKINSFICENVLRKTLTVSSRSFATNNIVYSLGHLANARSLATSIKAVIPDPLLSTPETNICNKY